MAFTDSNAVIQFSVYFKLSTGLMLHSGIPNEVVDNTIETTPDGGKLHINGYVWASLIRRALNRVEGGPEIADKIGKFNNEVHVSSAWFESDFVDLPDIDERLGIRISRKWGASITGGLYSEEVVPAGLNNIKMRFNYFYKSSDDSREDQKIADTIAAALWVIDQKIENIGGGWSYGFGRLKFVSGQWWRLDLSQHKDRQRLWSYKGISEGTAIQLNEPKVIKPWCKITLSAGMQPGQLLAVHTDFPLIETATGRKKLPDSFIFSHQVVTDSGETEAQVVMPGKTIRQALLSTNIERKLRTSGEKVCVDDTIAKNCKCPRCKWFGSTDCSGIIAVLDSPVKNHQTEIIHRIQLCEHSMQNINLFSGEYLTDGKFDMEIIIDYSRPDTDYQILIAHLNQLFNEMRPEKKKAPEGWYRIGATSTCTGQLGVHDVQTQTYGV